MLKVENPDKAAANLEFLMQTNLIKNSEILSGLDEYLKKRKEGEGAFLQNVGIIEGKHNIEERFWGHSRISVCWENPTPDDEAHRRVVRDAVQSTWARNSNLDFIGWQKCGADPVQVRILVDDKSPEAKAIGKALHNREEGVVLNFTFAKWRKKECQGNPKPCIRKSAIHVFGHVLGFTHEDNRTDASPDCGHLQQGPTDDFAIGPYDPHSVMNNCNPIWWNDGVLSDGDVQKIRMLYGAPNS